VQLCLHALHQQQCGQGRVGAALVEPAQRELDLGGDAPLPLPEQGGGVRRARRQSGSGGQFAAQPCDDVGEFGDQVVRVLLAEGVPQGVLVREVLVERADGDAGVLGDAVGGAGGVAVLGENVSSGGEDPLAGELGAHLPGRATWLKTTVGGGHPQAPSRTEKRVAKT
jgi:hypothetical protein